MSAVAMLHFVSTSGARLMGQPMYGILKVPLKRRENIGKPHDASESFCSEVAHVTSGHISLAKESHMTKSDINRVKKHNSAPERISKYFEQYYNLSQVN